jgi:hypothetical protein
MNAPRQWRYLPWLARDYFLWGGVATVVIMLFAGFIAVEPLAGLGAVKNPAHPLRALPPELMHRIEAQLLVMFGVIGPLVATRGVISQDRTLGYFRLLFARPLNGPLYYGVVFVINGLGVLVVGALLHATFSFFVGSMAWPRFLGAVALSYVFVGGIIFLLSSLWRHDLLSFIGVYASAALAWDVLTSTGAKGWIGKVPWLVEALPPVHIQSHISTIMVRGMPIEWSGVAWIGLYGLGCFALGLLLIRNRQLAKA